MMKIVTVNDIDGSTFETVAYGYECEVRSEYAEDHPVQRLISEAIVSGSACESYEIDGDEYTTKVIAR